MNKDYRDRWVTALRSGKYKQVFHALRAATENEEEGHCCLGVLCDVYDSTRWGEWEEVVSLPAPLQDEMGLDSLAHFDVASLPAELQAKVTNLGWPDSQHPSLAELNDAGAGFELIADIIEAEPKWLDNPQDELDEGDSK